jgi:hypothetical protein
VKAVVRGKFIAMRAYIKRSEKSQLYNLMQNLKILEKQEQAKPKTSRRTKIIKIRTKINEIETKKINKEAMKQNWFFEKIKKLTNLTKMRRGKNPNQ